MALLKRASPILKRAGCTHIGVSCVSVLWCHQPPSAAISRHQQPSAAISRHQRPSATISGHQQPSATISGHQPPAQLMQHPPLRQARPCLAGPKTVCTHRSGSPPHTLASVSTQSPILRTFARRLGLCMCMRMHRPRGASGPNPWTGALHTHRRSRCRKQKLIGPVSSRLLSWSDEERSLWRECESDQKVYSALL